MRPETGWQSAQRLEELAGEARVNLLRLAALAAFYGHHLLQVYFLSDDPAAAGEFHLQVSLVVFTWVLVALVVHRSVRQRVWLPALKFVVTAVDVLLITAILVIARDPRSAFVVLYFLVIAASALRLSLPLVYATTAASIAAYLVYLGLDRYLLRAPADQRMPPAQQVFLLLALGMAGLLAGQVVRQCRRAWIGHGVLLLDPQDPSPAAN